MIVMQRLNQVGRGLLGVFGVLVLVGLLGSIYESVAEAADARAYPPPGRMVDVGGYRLHINCVGTGSPTVVIDAGWGDSAGAWSSWVQPAVGSTTRICTYDRAGIGYSDSGPLPRTAQHFAEELHTLLRRADVAGPYVMVGHSLGGLTVRVFAHDYAAEVAGVVLIESMSPSQARPSPSATPTETASHSIADWVLTLPARTGMLRLLAGPVHAVDEFAPEAANPYSIFWVTPRSLQAWLDEGKGTSDSLAQAGAVHTFGATPLIVLSRGAAVDPNPDWQTMQTQLLELSPTSQQMFAEESGHSIEFDQPEAAVHAIDKMVEQTRAR